VFRNKFLTCTILALTYILASPLSYSVPATKSTNETIKVFLGVTDVNNEYPWPSTTFTLNWDSRLPAMLLLEKAPNGKWKKIGERVPPVTLTRNMPGSWGYTLIRREGRYTTYDSNTVYVHVTTPGQPVLYDLPRPQVDTGFRVDWTADPGVFIYQLVEDTEPDFSTQDPVQYWPTGNFELISHKEAGIYYYRVRGWSDLPENGGISGDWSNTITIKVLSDEEFLGLLERRIFDYFIATTYENGLTLDRLSTTDVPTDITSIAATGFYLSALSVGTERGWIDFDDAYNRARTTLQTLYHTTPNVHGFFYHFLNSDGTPSAEPFLEVSSIDTSILIVGALQAGEYFGGEIKDLADNIYRRVEWDWMFDVNVNLFRQAWTEANGFQGYYNAYSEAILLYLIAIGSPTHPVPADSFYGLHRPKGNYAGPDFIFTPGGELFTYQYPHAWFDFRNTNDALGVDWWQNSVEAILANRRYAIDNSGFGYNEYVWGLTACDGPDGYHAYGAQPAYWNFHDGTIAPTGIGGSVAFAPDVAVPSLKYLYSRHGDDIWSDYGFVDSFNLNYGWVDPYYISIDQGVMLLMLENLQSELIWNTFMSNEHVLRALSRTHFANYIKEDIVIENFEDQDFWTPESTVGWWDSDGTAVYRRSNSYYPVYEGQVSMKVEYYKNGLPWSLMGAHIAPSNMNKDFSFHDTLTLKMYGAGDILVKLRDQAQAEIDIGPTVTARPGLWREVSLDISGLGINTTAIDNLLFFVAPGSADANGEIYLDGIQLENRKPIIIEDFEDGDLWTPWDSLGWWDVDGTLVYSRSNAKDPSHGGFKSMRITYNKNGYPWSFFGGYIQGSNALSDFTQRSRLVAWVYGNADVLVKLRDRSLREAELGVEHATNSYGWTRLVFDYSGVDNIDLSDIDNILFFIDPGEAYTSGVVYIDDIAIE